MNEKTRIQIEEMKKQTIGVEVEMNNIDRSRAAKVAAASTAMKPAMTESLLHLKYSIRHYFKD